MYPFSKLNISLFGSARQTPASSSKNGILQIWEISPRNHITVLPCNYNLISCQNLLRMIQLVKPQKEGKQEQVKCSEKQMEAKSRWKGRREAAWGGGGGRKRKPNTWIQGNITQCPQMIKATWEQYKAIKSFEKTIGSSMGVPFSIKF